MKVTRIYTDDDVEISGKIDVACDSHTVMYEVTSAFTRHEAEVPQVAVVGHRAVGPAWPLMTILANPDSLPAVCACVTSMDRAYVQPARNRATAMSQCHSKGSNAAK